MGYRLSKIMTRTGDDGKTQLEPGQRLFKDDPRLTVIGTLDELNSAIGLILAHLNRGHDLDATLQQIQHDLFDLGGELCPPFRVVVTETKILFLENKIIEWNKSLPPLKEFILPGGSIPAAIAHLARTVCRRAERNLVTLQQKESFNPLILCYINRLSDLLFIAARLLNIESQQTESLWKHERKK